MTAGLSRGFTLLEMLLVFVLVSILGGYFMLSVQRSEIFTLSAQAHRLAADLDHARELASQWGQVLRFVTSQGGYSVRCAVSSAQPPCNRDPVLDPVTGRPFQVELGTATSWAALPELALVLDGMGRPVNADGSPLGIARPFSFTLVSRGASETVTVDPLSGRVAP